jgi:hypothetical protein
MGCVAGDEDEAFDLVKSMIMRRANNVALVAVEDVRTDRRDQAGRLVARGPSRRCDQLVADTR